MAKATKEKQQLQSGEKLVTGKELVDIVYTKDTKYHKKGDKSTVHQVQFEKLKARGIVEAA